MKITPLFRVLLLIVTTLLCQACQKAMLEASVDAAKHKVKIGSSGSNFEEDDEYSIGANLAYFIFIGPVGGLMGSKAGMHASSRQSISQPAVQNLLASTRNQLSFGALAPPPEPTSFFKSEQFAIMPGIQLVRKGTKISDSFGTDVTHLLYLEALAYALYRYQLPDNKGELFGGLGPYVGYGLSGNVKSTYNGQTDKFSAFDVNNGGFKRVDAGLAFTAGYQFQNSVRLRLAYELGLLNIGSGSVYDKTFNRAISLNVGYPVQKIVDKVKKK